MRISPVNNFSMYTRPKCRPAKNIEANSSYLNFTARPKLAPDAFFYKMDYYEPYSKEDKETCRWASMMNILANDAADLIAEKQDFDKVLDCIEFRVSCINSNPLYFGVIDKRGEKTRYEVPDFGRGSIYFNKYYEKFNKDVKDFYLLKKMKSNCEYKEANTATIVSSPYCGMFIEYGRSGKTNLDLVKKEYEKLIATDKPTLDEINKSCATIQ